jgi:hypothetical protein
MNFGTAFRHFALVPLADVQATSMLLFMSVPPWFCFLINLNAHE